MFPKLVEIVFTDPLVFKQLVEHLTELPGLTRLEFNGQELNRHDYKHLQACSCLSVLDINNPQVRSDRFNRGAIINLLMPVIPKYDGFLD